MVWSKKYKRSINCDNPHGFSQKAHCSARKKRQRGEETKSTSPFNEMHEVKSHKSVEQIAKKHRLDVSFVKKQLEMGIPIEHEHTKDKDLATDIALQHLDEIPDYYTRLKKMESDAKKEHKKFKDVNEHCGCEDNAVEELENQLKDLKNTSYDSIDKLMRRIMKKHSMTAKQLHNAFVDKNGKTPDIWIKNLKEGTLHHWFKGSKSKNGKPGWVQADGSPCANEPGETKTPKCFSSARLKSLKSKGDSGEALIKSAVRRKREADKGQQQKSGAAKPTMVATFAKGKKDPNYIKAEPGIREAMELNEAQKDKPGKSSGKKDACYSKVKSRYDVWPSAYASGALVKCRKVGAANWGTKSEETQMQRYCPKCKKDETRDECKYGQRYWDTYSIPIKLKDYTPNTPHPGNFPESYDHEYSMARSEISTIISAAKRLKKKISKGEGNLEAWVQSKITKAADYIDAAANYVDSGEMTKEDVSIKDANGNHYAEFIDIIKPEPLKPSKGIGSNLLGEGLSFEIGSKKTTGMGAMTPQDIDRLKQGNPGAADKIDQKYQQIRRGINLPLAKKETKKEVQVSHYEPDLKTFQQFMEDWQSVNRKDKTDGLSQKAVDAYRRENPGSKLQTAVTEKKPKGKRAKRRANFCRRMKGMKSKLTSAKTSRDPDSRINKALRRWNCH